MLQRMRATRRARRHGVLIPQIAWRAARDAGLRFEIACAVVMRESSGGHNVWHGDDTWMIDYPVLNADTYRVYEAHRNRFGYQGTGPVGLTWGPTQDKAEKYGGAWDPYANCRAGFEALRDLIDTCADMGLERPLWEGLRRYNGSGPDAERYADEMVEDVAQWREWLR